MTRKIAVEDIFWKKLSLESLKKAWNKEDKVWDKITEKHMQKKNDKNKKEIIKLISR